MQAAGVLASGHNRVVGEAPAPGGELKGEMRLDLGLVHAGLQRPQHAAEAFLRELARAADRLDLGAAFHQPELMHERREPAVIVQWKAPLHLRDEPLVARLHLAARAPVLVGIQVDVLRLAEHPAQDARKVAQPFHLLDPRGFLRLLLAQLVALPEFVLLVGFAEKKDLAQLFVVGPGEDQQFRLLLLHAGEVVEIAVWPHEERAVGIRRQNVVGVQDGQRLRGQRGGEAGAVFREKGWGERSVTHWRLSAFSRGEGKRN